MAAAGHLLWPICLKTSDLVLNKARTYLISNNHKITVIALRGDGGDSCGEMGGFDECVR